MHIEIIGWWCMYTEESVYCLLWSLYLMKSYCYYFHPTSMHQSTLSVLIYHTISIHKAQKKHKQQTYLTKLLWLCGEMLMMMTIKVTARVHIHTYLIDTFIGHIRSDWIRIIYVCMYIEGKKRWTSNARNSEYAWKDVVDAGTFSDLLSRYIDIGTYVYVYAANMLLRDELDALLMQTLKSKIISVYGDYRAESKECMQYRGKFSYKVYIMYMCVHFRVGCLVRVGTREEKPRKYPP